MPCAWKYAIGAVPPSTTTQLGTGVQGNTTEYTGTCTGDGIGHGGLIAKSVAKYVSYQYTYRSEFAAT